VTDEFETSFALDGDLIVVDTIVFGPDRSASPHSAQRTTAPRCAHSGHGVPSLHGSLQVVSAARDGEGSASSGHE